LPTEKSESSLLAYLLGGAWQRGPPLRRLGRREHEPGAPLRRLGEPRAPQYPLRRPLRRDAGAGVAHRGAELHDPGGRLGGVLGLPHEPLHLRPREPHLEPDGRGGAGERGGGRGEGGCGPAREHERLEPLPGPDAEVARPGAAHGPPGAGGVAARQRDEEVEPAPAERRVGVQRARAGAEELDVLRLEQLEARAAPQRVGGGRGRLHAEGGAVQLHHLGALALAPDAVPHPLSLSPFFFAWVRVRARRRCCVVAGACLFSAG
jgi:hypothetical protein